MKYLKTLLVISAILTVVIINYNCSDQNQVTSSNMNSAGEMKVPTKHISGDGATESYTFFIENYAYIVPDQGNPYYAWYQYKSFGCSTCWPNDPPHSPIYDYFRTPVSGDYIYDSDLMATIHWSSTYSNYDVARWVCETGHCDTWYCYEMLFQVNGIQNDVFYINSGNGANCSAGHYTGNLSQRTNSYTLAYNTQYNVTYGTVEVLADSDKNK